MRTNIKRFTPLVAVLMLAMSFVANAWIYQPQNQTDIDLQSYYITKYQNSWPLVSVKFYNETEHFGKVDLGTAYIYNSTGYTYANWNVKIFSTQTIIGNSYYPNPNSTSLAYKLMCPDGRSNTIKNHIALAKLLFTPSVYLPRSDGTACGSTPATTPPPPPPPGNVTPLSTIQSLYPGLTVSRLYSNRDIFKAECITITGCSTLNPNSDFRGWTYYLSNTKRIGYHFSDITAGDQYRYPYVRTTEGAPDQITADDINFLVNQYLSGQYIYWVNASSSYQYIQWFNY